VTQYLDNDIRSVCDESEIDVVFLFFGGKKWSMPLKCRQVDVVGDLWPGRIYNWRSLIAGVNRWWE
jgi:hypothetical protein